MQQSTNAVPTQADKKPQDHSHLFTSALLRPKVVCQYLNFGRTKLHELERFDSTFPRKIRVSSRVVGWRKSDLDNWLKLKSDQARGIAK